LDARRAGSQLSAVRSTQGASSPAARERGAEPLGGDGRWDSALAVVLCVVCAFSRRSPCKCKPFPDMWIAAKFRIFVETILFAERILTLPKHAARSSVDTETGGRGEIEFGWRDHMYHNAYFCPRAVACDRGRFEGAGGGSCRASEGARAARIRRPGREMRAVRPRGADAARRRRGVRRRRARRTAGPVGRNRKWWHRRELQSIYMGSHATNAALFALRRIGGSLRESSGASLRALVAGRSWESRGVLAPSVAEGGVARGTICRFDVRGAGRVDYVFGSIHVARQGATVSRSRAVAGAVRGGGESVQFGAPCRRD
jgi:hypothetical protein